MNEKVKKLTYTVEEAAEALGICRARAYDMVNIEGFPVVRIGRCIRIPKDRLEKWLNEQAEKQVTV